MDLHFYGYQKDEIRVFLDGRLVGEIALAYCKNPSDLAKEISDARIARSITQRLKQNLMTRLDDDDFLNGFITGLKGDGVQHPLGHDTPSQKHPPMIPVDGSQSFAEGWSLGLWVKNWI